ncbi:MAG: serpin family protein [Candidatus Marinimicrobia bacterium]|nr:serpin family protein [Candidatus Neomarinimicrobiota bacterium]
MQIKKIFLLLIIVVFSLSCKEKEITLTTEKNLLEGNNKFALKIFNNLSENIDRNIFISPYSISTALAMTYGGAEGETKDQMRKALFFQKNDLGLYNSFQYLIQSINELGNSNDNLELKTANAIWVENNFKIKNKFEELVKTKYLSEINGMDFVNKPEECRIEINNWASENTENKINDLIPEGLISQQTKLVLTNAIYFLADWQNQFKKRYTKEDNFYLSNGEKVKIKMMHQTEYFRYTENEKVQIIELPYENDRLSMIVFLPRSNNSNSADLLLTIDSFNKNIQDLRSEKIRLYLPKFKFTYFSLLNNVLQEMGMRDAFTSKADFSGINKNKRDALMISDVLHKAYIDVTEIGTEAAAATAVTMKLTSAPPTSKPITFRADHPFIFMIYDNQTEQILFIGKLNNPEK